MFFKKIEEESEEMDDRCRRWKQKKKQKISRVNKNKKVKLSNGHLSRVKCKGHNTCV